MKKIMVIFAAAATLMLSACSGQKAPATPEEATSQLETVIEKAKAVVANADADDIATLKQKYEELKAAGAGAEQLSKLQELIKAAQAVADKKINEAGEAAKSAQDAVNEKVVEGQKAIEDTKAAAKEVTDAAKATADAAKQAVEDTKNALKALKK